jgi:DNA repair ATPase RecN
MVLSFLTHTPRLEKYFKKLMGNADIEDSLARLDKLTQEEARMASVELLKMTNSIDGKVMGVDDRVKGVEGNVQDVRSDVQDVGSKVQGVDDRMQGIGSEVRDVDEKLDQVNRSLSL